MKGQIRVKVEVTDECGHFPITETWCYERDNTFEDMEDWISLFDKILVVQGFGITLNDWFCGSDEE